MFPATSTPTSNTMEEFPVVMLLLTLVLSQAATLLAEDCTTGFSVVAPELAVPGKTTAVLVTLHGPTSLQPLNVTLRLLPLDGSSSQQLVETTQEIKGHGILPLGVPSGATGSYVLQTLVNCTESGSEKLRNNRIRPSSTDDNPIQTSKGSAKEENGDDQEENDDEEEGLDSGHRKEKQYCQLQSTSQMRLVGPVRDVIIRPAKHAYRPGETVSFWVLALDHDLQIASGAIGSISVKDPAGTKVALWDQIPLDEGVKAFSLPLSEYVRTGRWLLHVEVESAEFSAPIEISPGAGNGLPDVAAAEEHYVELRFGKEMRRRYKPGLPFSGKVEAMSTEKSVRVRVKVYDNTTSIYSQDIEISNGEGTFVVPAILADSDVIALQAELVSVESKEIESHYVLAREPIHKWNSSSDCYLLIEGVEHTLQPEEEAHVTILSTCPCERDLHYVITTDGRVTDWAQRRYEDPLPSSTSAGAVCRLNFSFTVRSVMAPVSQLLVYYVTPQGEPVSDVISFDVKLLHRQVYVNLEEREWWLPGQSLDLEVIAERSSLVCLLGGRSGGNGDVKFDPRISEEHEPTSVEGEIDFLEAGVSFFQRQCVKRGNSGISAVSYRQRGSGAGPSNRRRPPESLVGGAPFDQLWLWKCFNYSSEIASTGLTISAPQEAGKWSLWALTVSTGNGLRFSSPVNVRIFRPLQAEFHLPPNLRVRETLEVDIKIGNNINSCMDVTALLALSEGAQFLSNGLLYVTERLRLGPHGATSLVVRILVTTPGLKNMTVEVNGYTSPSCEGAERPGNTSLAGTVLRSATINVYPEGMVRTDTESAYFCANENLVISTSEKYKYEWIGAPRNHDGIILELKSGTGSKRIGPVHVALAENRSPSDKMYRLTIGDVDNTISWIGRGKHMYGIQLARAQTPGILSEDEWRIFWITWDKNTVAFGNGSIPHNNTLIKWRMDKKIKIQQVGFSSSWGSLAEFRIWNFNEEAGFSQVLHLDTPKSVVPGSEQGRLLIAGGLALPAMNKKIEAGEGGLSGALASLTPALTLLHSGRKINESEREEVLRNLPGNIQSVLSYRKMDNSFSEHQMLGSHTATVYILEALTKVQSYFSIDSDLIQSIKRWVQLRQEDDGRFTPLPADIKLPSTFSQAKQELSRDSLNFSTSEVGLSTSSLDHITEITAETVIALYEIGIETDTDADTIQKAKIFLENSLPKIESAEAISAVALAMALVRSATSLWAIEKLRNASTTEDGEFGWPHFIPKRDAADWLYESPENVAAGKSTKEPLTATLSEYKASLHALSTFCLIGDLKFAESVARYLFYRSHLLDQHPELLYHAVKAFTHYDLLAKDRHRSLTVSLATSGMELTDTLELKLEKSRQELILPSLPTKVFVYATGAGCATIQGKVTYSTYSVKPTTPLLDLWSGIIQEILPDRSSVEEIEGKLPMLKVKTCFLWKGSKPSGVLRLEISLFSGFELVSTTPPQLLSPFPENMAEMQHSYHNNQLWFIFANVSSDKCPICVQYMARSVFVISSLRPAHAKIYPAGRQDLAAETFFHAKSGSNLLKSITEDDLITWFGKNLTHRSDFWEFGQESCHASSSTNSSTTSSVSKSEVFAVTTSPGSTLNDSTSQTSSSTTSSVRKSEVFAESSTLGDSTTTEATVESSTPTLNNSSQQQKLEVLSVATYTINVDNDSISSSSSDLQEEVEATNSTSIDSVTMATDLSTTSFETDNVTDSLLSIEENIIPDDSADFGKKAGDSVNATWKIVQNELKNGPENATDSEQRRYKNGMSSKSTAKNATTQELNSQSANVSKINLTNAGVPEQDTKNARNSGNWKVNASNPEKFNESAQIVLVTTSANPQTEQKSNVSKHVNTPLHQKIPQKLLLPNRKIDQDPDQIEPATFPPEIKNDQYVLLDREELWGMLKEVVDNQLKEKISTSEIVTANSRKKFRNPGMT